VLPEWGGYERGPAWKKKREKGGLQLGVKELMGWSEGVNKRSSEIERRVS
jgi:hypothetical protein